MSIKRALISVTDKSGVEVLARYLIQHGVEILSTGGTLKYLESHGFECTDVSDYTGFPEMMGGRLKTLHPLVHGGILGRRGIDDGVMEEHSILPIDLVVVNLYDFKSAIESGIPLNYIIEQIDIGGPAMLRSAAKNYNDVVVLSDKSEYEEFIRIYDMYGYTTITHRLIFAHNAFRLTAAYDKMIAEYLRSCLPNVIDWEA